MRKLGAVQEVLVLGLMFVTIIALFYLDISLSLKVGLIVLSFTIVLLMSIASQLLSMQKEADKTRRQ
ncbi:MAG: hypothetical protein LBE76_07290 [Nitrososphaerota archaeon]|nr:hypothetical protein [Nitrososphaerota archaeon]